MWQWWFSPTNHGIHRSAQVYHSILRSHAGRIENRENLKHTARQSDISQSMSSSTSKIIGQLQVCKEQCNCIHHHGSCYQWFQFHLYNRLDNTCNWEDNVAEKQILAIIQWEKDCIFWWWLNNLLGKDKATYSVWEALVEDVAGNFMEYSSQHAVEQAIWGKVHCKGFHLAEKAPICQGDWEVTSVIQALSRMLKKFSLGLSLS